MRSAVPMWSFAGLSAYRGDESRFLLALTAQGHKWEGSTIVPGAVPCQCMKKAVASVEALERRRCSGCCEAGHRGGSCWKHEPEKHRQKGNSDASTAIYIGRAPFARSFRV